MSMRKLKYLLIQIEKCGQITTVFEEHYKHMDIAIEEAVKAFDKNEVPIGAVLVDKKMKVITKSHNQTIMDCDPTAHAEIKLLRGASTLLGNYRLLGTTLYVTLEPCVMCMGAIIHARVSTVVFGITDEKWGAAGSLYDFTSDLRFNHKVKIIKGIYADRCRSLMVNFFRNRRKNILMHV